MPAETAETTFDTEYGGFIAPEYEQPEIANDNETAIARVNDNEPAAERFESLEFLTSLVIDHKGGTVEDWTNEYSGAGFTFDGTNIRNEQGEVWPHADPEMLAQWQNNESSIFRLPDHEERIGDEIKLSVTHIVRNPDDTVRYEIHSTRFRVGETEESNPLQDWKYRDAMPSLWQSESLYDIDTAITDGESAPQTIESAAGVAETATIETSEPDLVQAEEETVTEVLAGAEEHIPEYSFAAVLKSLEHLAVFPFPDEQEAAVSFAETVDAQRISAHERPAPTPIIERAAAIPEIAPLTKAPAPRESAMPSLIARPETPRVAETAQPEKPIKTSVEPARATAERETNFVEKTVAPPPTLEPMTGSSQAPTPEARMQAAVQELLRDDEAPLETFFADNEIVSTPSVAEIPVVEEISEPIADAPAVAGAVPAIAAPARENPAAWVKATVAEQAVDGREARAESERILIKPETTIPAPATSVERIVRATHENEFSDQRIETKVTKESATAPISNEALQGRKVASLSEDDILPSPNKMKNNAANSTTRFGITLNIAA